MLRIWRSMADKLSDGFKALLTNIQMKFNSMCIRAAAPWLIPRRMVDMTKKCALNSRLEKDRQIAGQRQRGHSLFHFPRTAFEAIWNHLVLWGGTLSSFRYHAWLVNAAGRKIMTSDSYTWTESPYWDPKSNRKDTLVMILDNTVGPPNRSGEGIIVKHPTDRSKPQLAWQYLPGQRRVKLAPEIAFDGPSVLGRRCGCLG